MAVTRLGAGVGAMTAGTAATFNGPNLAASDGNTYMVVGVVISVSSNSTATTCGVTCGGVSMTQLSLTLVGTSTNRNAVGIYYLANPGTGTKSIVATPGGASTKAGLVAQAVAFSNVRAVGAAQTAITTSHSVTSETDGYALRVLGNANALTSPNQTNEYLNGQTVAGSGDYGVIQSAAGSASVSFTCTGTAAQANSVAVSLAPVLAKAATLTDDFTSQDTAKWSGYGANIAVVSGQLNITAQTSYPTLSSQVQYDLTSSSVYVEVVQTLGTGDAEVYLLLKTSASDYLLIDRAAGGNSLLFRERVSAVNDDTSVTYNATSHRWWRIRESGGTIFWDTSPDGSTWTNQKSKTAGLTPSTVTVTLQAGYGATAPSPNTAIFDNFNIVPSTSGTIAANLQKATAALAGVMQPSGTIAAQLQKAVFAASGAQTQTGTVAALLQAATANLAGTQAQTGTAAAVLRPATTAAAGAQAQTGSAAPTLQPATMAASGDQAGLPPTGTIGATAATATASLAGAQTQTGTITATTQPATAQATGAQTQQGTIAATLQPTTLAAAGTMQPSGTVTAALRPATGTVAGAQTHTGTVAGSMRPALLAGQGAEQPSGTISASLVPAAASAAGTQAQTGTIAASIQNPLAALSGVMQPSGTVSSTLRPATAAAVGQQAGVVILAAALQPATASLSGVMQPRGTIAASIPPAAAVLVAAQAQQGVIAANLADLAAALSGSHAQSGDIAAQLHRASAVLVGGLVETGTIGAALRTLVAAALGASGETLGAIDVTLQHLVAFARFIAPPGPDNTWVVAAESVMATLPAESATAVLANESATSVLPAETATHALASETNLMEV